MNSHFDTPPETWDWSLPNKAVAEVAGVSVTTAFKWRGRLHKPPVDGYVRRKIFNAETWDWSKTNDELAKAHGVSAPAVYAWRKKLHKAEVKPQPVRRTETCGDWDWSKRDAVLARTHGLSRERVRQIRRAIKAPKPPPVAEVNLAEFRVVFKRRRKLTHAEMKAAGYTDETGLRYCKKLGIRIEQDMTGAKPHVPWDKMNWSLPDSVLNDAWGLGKNGAGNARSKQGRPKAAFRTHDGQFPVEHLAAVLRERKRGAAFKAAREAKKNSEAPRGVMAGTVGVQK